MGGDGGSTALERKFMRGTKSNGVKDSKNTLYTRMVRARECALSSQPLREPIVCCELGHLYNKEELLSALLDPNIGEGGKGISDRREFRHITKMKDVKELRFHANPQFMAQSCINARSMIRSTASRGGCSIETATSLAASEGPCPFSCPVTGVEFNGKQPFVALWTTGYVLSEKAIREMDADSLQQEYRPFNRIVTLPATTTDSPSLEQEMTCCTYTEDDIIKLLPETLEERKAAVDNMKKRRLSARHLKGHKPCAETRKRKLDFQEGDGMNHL